MDSVSSKLLIYLFLFAHVNTGTVKNYKHKNSELQCKKERKQNVKILTHANQDCQLLFK